MNGRICIIRQYSYELPVRREAETLRNTGFDVDVICLHEDGHKSYEIDNGVHVYRIPLQRKRGNFLRYIWDYFAFFIFAGLKVSGLHIRHRYKVIQVNTMPDFLVFATIVPRLMGAKVIAFMKEPTPELSETLYGSRKLSSILKVIEQLVLKYAHAAFTVTEQLKAVYVSRGAKAEKIRVILNVPDAQHFLDLVDTSFHPDPNYYTLIYHGTIEERYGHDIVVKAIKLVRPIVPNVRLRILGTGDYVDTMLKLIEELQLEDCVSYLGFVSREILVEELVRADAGLVAQKSSAYSNLVHTNKMYEYMVFGKPAIISRLDSVYKCVDESCVQYYEPDDPQSLADAIADLHQHPEKALTLVENAREFYKGVCWESQKQTFLGVYENLLDKSVSSDHTTHH